MAINVGDNFSYQGKKYLDDRQSFKTLSELQAYSNVPEGFIAYCEEDKKRYEYVGGSWLEYVVDASSDINLDNYAEKTYVDELIETHTHDEYLTEHQDISHLATKEEIPSLDGYATELYVQEQIANAELGGEEVDLSHLVSKEELEQKGYLTEHQDISHLVSKEELEQKGYLTEHQDISHLATKEEIPSLDGYATQEYVRDEIANIDFSGRVDIDTSNLATKAELNTKFDDVEVNEEETTDSQTALDFFANGEKIKTVYFSGGSGGSGAAAYISTTLPENAMVETGYNFDILIDFYSPNPGKGTLKVFVNDVDVLSTAITQGETTTTLTHDKLSKGTNKVVVYVMDRIGTMSNSLTFYVRYGSTELIGEFDSSLSYDYGSTVRYYFTATALDTSLALTFYMNIDGSLQNGVSCVSDVRGYFTFPNTLEPGGHRCECWVEDSNGGKSNVESFNLVLLDYNTIAIVSETQSVSIEEGSQLSIDYRVYKKNETSFIIKTYVDEELVSTGTCGLTTSYYKTTKLREGMHNIKIEAWDVSETVSDYITWTVIITPSTYTMLEPSSAGSIFIATAQNRTNGDADRDVWIGHDQDGKPITAPLINFAFNSESGWMDDQLFITGNSYVEIPIQPLANNARYGFTLDVEFSTKPIGVDDAEVLSVWNDVDNCGIKITTEQLILQSKSGNKCELYFTENEIVSAIFIIDRHEKTAKIYLNGVMCAAFALSDYVAEGVSYLEDFTVNGNLFLGGKGKNGYATIKNLRVYELALSSSEVLNNFMANEIDKAAQQELVNFQKGEDLPTVTVYCDFSGLGKDDKKYCDIVYNSPDPVKYGESFSLMGKYSQLQYQGTSSMQYPIKNYRLNPRDANGKVKIKLPNCQPETRFTLKADFMSSGHWQNTGLTKWVNDNLYNYKEDDPKSMNPAKWWAIQNGKDPNDYRECIYGFPCRLILVNDGNSPLNEGQQEPTPGNTKDMGIFNFNLDKDCQNSLGFTIDDFPNAVSMEVTANSDTSAGAFMSYEKPFPNTIDYFWAASTGAHLTMAIDIDKFNMRTVNIPSYNYETTNNIALAIYKADRTWIQNLSITPSTNYTFPDTAAYFTLRLNSIPESIIINDTTFNIGKEETENATAFASEPYYVSTGDANLELAYLQESFELRYGNEDVEGWGFMFGMSQQDTIDYSIQDNEWGRYFRTSRMSRAYFGTDWRVTITAPGAHDIAIYNEDGTSLSIFENNGVFKLDEGVRMFSIRYTDFDIPSFTINDKVYHIGEFVDASVEKDPYLSYQKDTSYGLKALIDWVDNSTDEQFVAEFEEHFHKDYTLRYFLLVMVLGMVDNLGKNMMLDSYDGKIWMPRFYDCDTICSYDNSGAIKFDVDIEMAQGYWNTSSSRLWTRVRDLFHDELVVKYNDMRQNGLSFESLMNVFYNEQIAKIPQRYYNMDADVKYLPYAAEYLGKAHGDGYEHLKRWLKNRLIFTDSLYDYAPSYTNDMITFRANTTELMSVTIETYTPVYQHVSWYNGNMQKEKITKGTRFTFSGYAQAATDQEVLVYGGSNIKRITGISSMNPNSMLIGNATRIVELSIPNCPILTDINSNKANLSAHTYLNKVDISNCPMLGGSLRLNYSPLVQEINAMNTAVTDLQLPSSIRNLHTLKLPKAVKNLTLNDASLLETLEFDGPNELESVSMTNCNSLKNVVNFDMTQIPVVTLNNSYDVDELYMSKTTNLSLINMPKVKKLIFVPNNQHETFNLTELRNSPDYVISAVNCPNLKTFITTAPYRESCDIAVQEVFQNGAFCANTLDISNTKITDVNFLCTTDIYQLKLPDTVNNFICDSAFDLDTDYLPDGDFDTVHHDFIEAYTANYNNPVVIPRGDEDRWYYNDATLMTWARETSINQTTGNTQWTSGRQVTSFIKVIPGTNLTLFGSVGLVAVAQYDKNQNYISAFKPNSSTVTRLSDKCMYIRLDGTNSALNSTDSGLIFYPYKEVAPDLTPSAADGSLIFSMYAPTVNSAVPAEGIWDLYGLTFEEFYTYGMNNDIVLTDGILTMPHRYPEYNVTIQNANISPTNYPTMLYPLLVNENQPILGTIDYSNYKGDDLSYTMAYANRSEVDITIPNNVQINSNYIYNIDKDSEYTCFDPRTIAKYTSNASGVLPTFNDGYTTYKVNEENNDGIYTTTIIANSIDNLPSKINFEGKTALLTVEFLNTSNITDMSRMFYECTNVTSINTSDWDTSKVTNLYYAFYSCQNLTSLDAGGWDTRRVTNMTSAFRSCSRLSALNVDGWDTSSVTGMSAMFDGCASLTSLDLSHFSSNKANDFQITFRNCIRLTDLNLSGLITSNATNMQQMFEGCSKLTNLDMSNWDVSEVTNMRTMFYGCSSLTSLDLSNWDTSNVNTMYSMFQNCSSLTSLDVSGWGTSNVTNMQNMFLGCSGLTSLDLSSFETSEQVNASGMFQNCTGLTQIKWVNWKPTVSLKHPVNLTKECLKDLLANLATVTNGQTLTLDSINLAKLTDEDKAIAINKGWTLA